MARISAPCSFIEYLYKRNINFCLRKLGFAYFGADACVIINMGGVRGGRSRVSTSSDAFFQHFKSASCPGDIIIRSSSSAVIASRLDEGMLSSFKVVVLRNGMTINAACNWLLCCHVNTWRLHFERV